MARERTTGGRFKNSGADGRCLVMEFVTGCIVSGWRTIQEEVADDIISRYPDTDGKYIVDLNKIGVIGGGRSKDQLCLNIDQSKNKLIEYLPLMKTTGSVNINMISITGNRDGWMLNDNELKMLTDVFPEVCDQIAVSHSQITDLGLLPRMVYPKSISLLWNPNITSLAGCPDCILLDARHCKNLRPLAGSKIRRLEWVDVSNCDIRSLERMPPLVDGSSLRLNNNKHLHPSDLQVCKVFLGVIRLSYLSVDSGFFSRMTYRDVYDQGKTWGDTLIDNLHIVMSKRDMKNLMSGEFIYKLPANVTNMHIFYPGGGSAIDDDELLESAFKRIYRKECNVRISSY